jgi:hypothetical protein
VLGSWLGKGKRKEPCGAACSQSRLAVEALIWTPYISRRCSTAWAKGIHPDRQPHEALMNAVLQTLFVESWKWLSMESTGEPLNRGNLNWLKLAVSHFERLSQWNMLFFVFRWESLSKWLTAKKY